MPSLRLDHDLVLDRKVGRSGLTRAQVKALVPRFREVHEDIIGALEADALPHYRLVRERSGAETWIGRGLSWASRHDRVVVVGEPASCAALLVLGGGPRVVVVDSLDPEGLGAAFMGVERGLLLVLDGPQWVRSAAAFLASNAAAILVLSEHADEASPFEGAECITEVGLADPRFGVVGGAALALCAFSGRDAGAVVDALVEIAERCSRPGVFDNPAYRLAGIAAALKDRGMGNMVLLLPTRRLDAWARWAVGAWAATTCKGDGGSAPVAALVGDEAAVQRMNEGLPDTLAVSLWVEHPGGGAEHAGAWSLAEEVLSAQIRHLIYSGRPVLRVVFGELDAPSLAALSFLFLHAAVATAARAGVDPLAMPAADRWRDMQAEEANPAE